jgi:hypothetical protein
MTRVSILNSRQSKTPVGNDPWVKATLSAVAHAAKGGWTIVSSYGLNTWELVTWAAGRHSANLILVCPDDITDDQKSDFIRRFDLRADSVEWKPVPHGAQLSRTKDWWEGRDEAVTVLAEVLVPVSIRKGGRLESVLQARELESVDEQFRVRYSESSHHLRFDIIPDSANPELRTWGNDWLIHWTRACNGPWPGETEAEYYSALANPGDAYCHSGFQTLSRILQEKRIRASSWRIGSGVPVVGLTELSPIDSISLMRWRPRWSRWSIEPYGVAIHRDAAQAVGLKPVEYIGNSDWDSLPESAKPYSHVRGKKADIWPAEREWRVAGDIDMTTIPTEHIRLITLTQSERDAIAQNCEYHVSCFE